jgi:hypothetical protein
VSNRGILNKILLNLLRFHYGQHGPQPGLNPSFPVEKPTSSLLSCGTTPQHIHNSSLSEKINMAKTHKNILTNFL